jgi:hypothetical protein
MPVGRPRDAQPPDDRAAAGPDLEHLEAEARYARDRLELYRARTLTGRDTSPARLRELERVAAAAGDRLAHARRS